MKIPQHIAIIMDGNGRWAQQRGLERCMGHQQGVVAVREITEAAARLGVKYLTLYTFSTENWHRPEAEVTALMGLIMTSLEEELFMKNNVKLRVIGDRERLPHQVDDALRATEGRTAANTGMTMVLALSYSARWEIAKATQAIAREVAEGSLRPEDITEDTLAQHLTTAFMPDPELLIRTGGEYRLSNYLLWQSAYTELYFTPTYWPDFDTQALTDAIADYNQRERRFGKTSAQVQSDQQ
ncbi:MAG: isoprenyl transferase [Bacteroidales bacterium]|nr:isoprenyl transferase [Candidatus Equimonas enterica]